MKSVRKLITIGLVVAGLSASAAPAYAAPTGPGFCQLVPRICQALCIGQINRCGRA